MRKNLTRQIMEVIVRLRGATTAEIINELAASEIYPNEDSLRAITSELAKRGFLTKEEKIPCDNCGHPGKKVYASTDKGKIYLAGVAA
jgi:DNA-binding PadR family transcriptional regulator